MGRVGGEEVLPGQCGERGELREVRSVVTESVRVEAFRARLEVMYRALNYTARVMEVKINTFG